MDNEGKVLFHALFRPRSLLIGLGGMGSTFVLALLIKWWIIIVGALLTASAYGWSVAESLSNRDFIEHVERPAITAGVSHAVELTVAAKRGSHLLAGDRRKEHQRLAQISDRVTTLINNCQAEIKVLVQDLPGRLRQLISDYEHLAVIVQDLEKKGGDQGRQATINAELDNIRQAIEALETKVVAIEGFTLDEVRGHVTEMWDEVAALETTVEDLKLLE